MQLFVLFLHREPLLVALLLMYFQTLPLGIYTEDDTAISSIILQMTQYFYCSQAINDMPQKDISLTLL